MILMRCPILLIISILTLWFYVELYFFVEMKISLQRLVVEYLKSQVLVIPFVLLCFLQLLLTCLYALQTLVYIPNTGKYTTVFRNSSLQKIVEKTGEAALLLKQALNP